MILYKSDLAKNSKVRPTRKMNVCIEEMPTRPTPVIDIPKKFVKYIKTCEQVIRSSTEYREYMAFLKKNMDMNKCIVLRNLKNGDGKKYSIEIHHEPFTLFDIVETVINKWLDMGKELNTLLIADEVMQIHYAGNIGLVPLTVTMHQLVTDGKVFIPLQLVFQSYNKFFEEYEPYMTESLLKKIEAKVNLSLKSGDIISDVLDPEFTYIKIDGFNFPEVPDEWKDIFNNALEINNI